MTSDGSFDHKFADGFKPIAINCSQIKSFSFNTNSDSDLIRCLSALKAFKRLKRLKFGTIFKNAVNTKHTFELFDGFEDLTHLTITYSSDEISETLLTNIDNNLPNLRYLNTNRRLGANHNTIDTLSRLSRLETIKLNLRHESNSFRLTITESLIKNCKYIRNIELDSP